MLFNFLIKMTYFCKFNLLFCGGFFIGEILSYLLYFFEMGLMEFLSVL